MKSSLLKVMVEIHEIGSEAETNKQEEDELKVAQCFSVITSEVICCDFHPAASQI